MRHPVILRLAIAAFSLGIVACDGSGGDSKDVPGTDSVVQACASPLDCDDGDACTVDRCIAGRCDHVARDCNDNNPCTTDECNGGACVNNAILGCCVRDTDCDDGNFCTPDHCTAQKCVSDAPVSGCCNTRDQCDDGNECTYDDCIQHKCTHMTDTKAGCCLKDSDCLDGNACTDDKCVDGRCKYTNRGCCQSDDDCTSEDPCEVGVCGGNAKCTFTRITDCCVKDADCPEVICNTATCVSGKCQRTAIERCCVLDEDCKDACLECTIPFNQNRGDCTLKTTPECCTATLLTTAFTDLSGFTVEGMKASGYAATPTWVIDTKRYVSAPGSLYFGDPATHTYEAAATMKVGGRAVSPALDLGKTVDPVLTFQWYKDTDVSPTTDVLSVIVIADGKDDRVAWSTSTLIVPHTNKAWSPTPVSVNLGAFQGEVVRLAFEFDSKDVWPTNYEGTYIDDVSVAGRCPQ